VSIGPENRRYGIDNDTLSKLGLGGGLFKDVERIMNNNGNFGGAEGLLSSQQIATTLAGCQQIVLASSREPFQQCLKSLAAQLMEFAEATVVDAEQAHYFEIHRSVNSQARGLEGAFAETLVAHFEQFKDGQLHTHTGEEKYSKDMLSLVENEDLEETIAISSINHAALDENVEQLWQLAMRFGALRGRGELPAEQNPISPVQFCEAMRQALGRTEWDAKIKILAYRTFSKLFVPTLASLYLELNLYLSEKLGLPELDYASAAAGSAMSDIYAAGDEQSALSEAQDIVDDGTQPSQNIGAGAGAGAGVGTPDASQPTDQYQSHLFSAIRSLQGNLQAGNAGVVRQTTSASVPMGQPGAFVPGSSGLRHIGSQLNRLGPSSQGFVPAQEGAAVFNEEQLLAALQNLQDGVSAATAEIMRASSDQPIDSVPAQSVATLVRQFSEELLQTAEEEGQAVDNNDMQIIDLVGMVFDYMLSDDNLPNSIKTLLSYLHTPFLKTAFIDPDFFESPDHPARLLLNSLAEAGIRWVSNDGTAQYDIYPRVRNVVQRILDDFDSDIRIYAELLLDFSSYTKKIARRQELLERRATEKVQGEERLREVKIKVNKAVNQRISGVELPSAVLLLLLQPWSDYLVFVLLRHGDDSTEWDQALETIADVVWSVQPKEKPEERTRQLELHDSLCDRLQAGFDTIAYEQDKIDKLCDALAALQKMALQSKSVELAPQETRNKLEIIAAKKAGATAVDENISEEEQRMVNSLKMIEFGTWFEFGAGRRLKVAWYNSTVLQYMLVDQMGKKVAMKSGLELAREMLSGEARVISGSTKPFFERALENIFHSLNAQAESIKPAPNKELH